MARVFITGSSDGLGYLAAKLLMDQGHQVVVHGRNQQRAHDIQKRMPNTEAVLIGDLANIEETKNLAHKANKSGAFDAVIHNAGIYRGSGSQLFTVNVLAPYMLTCLMHKPQRLIYLCSRMHLQGQFKPTNNNTAIDKTTYSDSKLYLMSYAGRAEFYNKRWYDYTGLPGSEAEVLDWQEVVHPDDLEQMIDCLTKILDADQPGELETRLRAKDGTYRWFLVRLQPLFSNGHKADTWAVIAAGIDNLKKLQQEKDDFISIASHELKSPLTTLKASLQLMDRTKNSGDFEKFHYFIHQANKSMHKVSTLVDDLLNVRRINEAQLPLNQKSVKVFELINGCCNHISITTNHNLVITGDKDLEVLADEAAIDRVIVNLVNNAVKYAPDAKDIGVRIERIGRMAKISVIDSGPGIAPEKLPRIFERYYQAEKSPFNNPGLGLGLFISAEIVRRHGGRMGVESEVGKGSTFWFTLPLADVHH